MSNSEWDKLWEEKDMVDECRQGMDTYFWLNAIKTEGDRLQKHNEFLLKEIDNYSEALIIKSGKLDDIRELCNTTNINLNTLRDLTLEVLT